jgi:hypothetical protein
MIVVLVVATRQAGESIPRIIVREDTKLDLGDDVTIIVCHHHFQREFGEISTFNKSHKVKILALAIDHRPPFPTLHERCQQIHTFCSASIDSLRSRKPEK